jgi:hypothetical protein
LIGALVLFVAACDETQQTSEPEAVFDESSINSVWHKAKLRGVAFRAVGQEAAKSGNCDAFGMNRARG